MAAQFTLDDLSRTPPEEIPDRGLACHWWDVATGQPRQARVRVPRSQSQDPSMVLAALNREVSTYGRAVVEKHMCSTGGHELLVGYDDADRPRGSTGGRARPTS